VPAVLEAMTLGPTGRQGQDGVELIEGLDGRLLSSRQKTAACWGGCR